MAEITLTYCVLAHESTARVERLVDKLLSEDATGRVIVHFDKKSGKGPFEWLRERYLDQARCHILPNRIKCGWGQWSLVEASLRMLRHAQLTCKTDYYYLLSEYCYPTQPLSALKQHLAKHRGANFIECEDASWIKGGIREDRYLYRHFLNKRKYPKLHRWVYKWQKWSGLKRKVPDGLIIRFGSQWWCLTQEAVEHVLTLEPHYRDFFRWVWIPDECFFATLVRFDNLKSVKLTYAPFCNKGTALNIDFKDIESVEKRFFFFRKVY